MGTRQTKDDGHKGDFIFLDIEWRKKISANKCVCVGRMIMEDKCHTTIISNHISKHRRNDKYNAQTHKQNIKTKNK